MRATVIGALPFWGNYQLQMDARSSLRRSSPRRRSSGARRDSAGGPRKVPLGLTGCGQGPEIEIPFRGLHSAQESGLRV